MVFEKENIAKGAVDKEALAHLVEACIFNNGDPMNDIAYFRNMLNQSENILHMQLEVMERIE